MLGILRGGEILIHEPLLAYANSYDEVRYTACFGLYPDRPGTVAPTDNSPDAPFSHYAFMHSDQPMCYWSSELLPQAIAVLAYHIDHALTGADSFPVRWIGAIKFVLLLMLGLRFTMVWWRCGRPLAALANAALFPLIFTDPANTLYVNTFYAEWTALLALYATISFALLSIDQPRTRLSFSLLTFAALLLGMSKIQHLLLPLALAVAVLLLGRLRNTQWPWQGAALLCGALLAFAVQAVQLQRDQPMMRGIHAANAADVVFTGLLPASEDPARALKRLGLAPECLAYIGRHAWELPPDPNTACPGLENFNRRKELTFLAAEPATAWRFARMGVEQLDSWLARNLGTVEGGATTPLPGEFISLSRPLLSNVTLRLSVFAAPLIAFCVLLLIGLKRVPQVALYFTVMVAVTMLLTYGVTILGDGLADTAKQSHLLFNSALAWIAVGLLAAFMQIIRRLAPVSEDETRGH